MQKLRNRWESDRLPQLSQGAQRPQFKSVQLEFDGFGHPELNNEEGREVLEFFVRASSFFGYEIQALAACKGVLLGASILAQGAFWDQECVAYCR